MHFFLPKQQATDLASQAGHNDPLQATQRKLEAQPN